MLTKNGGNMLYGYGETDLITELDIVNNAYLIGITQLWVEG